MPYSRARASSSGALRVDVPPSPSMRSVGSASRASRVSSGQSLASSSNPTTPARDTFPGGISSSSGSTSSTASSSGAGSRGETIHVCVRVRYEERLGPDVPSPWVVVDDTTLADVEESQERQFGFEHVFGMEAKNKDVYERSVRPVVEQALRGVNGSVFAYGQTNSGKTHTMTGVRSDPGILWRAVQHLFEGIKRDTKRVFLLRCSYFEIYNEETRDLLDMEKGSLSIREKNGKFFVDNLTEKIVTSTSQIVDIVRRGEANRSFGVSNLHEHSSRSHTIFRVTVESTMRTDTTETPQSQLSSSDLRGAVQVAELNLVDLAGSECLAQAPGEGQQRETIHINLSLTQLKSVIQALSRGGAHVPFRNSALTKIMRNSLGGNSRTLVLCTLSPLAEHRKQSRMTLLFGELAKRIENRPRVNEVLDNDAAVIHQYQRQIDELNKKLTGYEELEQQKLEIHDAYLRLKKQMDAYREQAAERSALSKEMQTLSHNFVSSNNVAAAQREGSSSSASASASASAAAAAAAPRGGVGAGTGTGRGAGPEGSDAGAAAGPGREFSSASSHDGGRGGHEDWNALQELGEQINSAVAVSVVTHAGQGLVVIRETYQSSDGQTRFGAEGIALSLENWAKLKGVIPNIDADINRYVMGRKAHSSSSR